MAKFNGTEFAIFIVGSPGNKKMADVTNNGLTIGSTPIDVSTKDSAGWKEIIAGQRSWSMNVEGIVDLVAGVGESTLVDLVQTEINRTMVTLMNTTGKTGDTSFTGTGILTNLDISAPMEDRVTWTADIEGSGPLTLATIA